MNKVNNGFTLVELAIVMTIIGLLIGGILKGQQLIENAKITATISQIGSYSTAVTIFRDNYSSYPGDFSRAATRLPNCTVLNQCVNGNEDGLIGISDFMWRNVDNTIASENSQFWKHLVLSDLISGVEPGATSPEWGRSHPYSKFNGGFFMRHSSGNTALDGKGHILVLRNSINGARNPVAGTMPISPSLAGKLDRKMDDGRPSSGHVMAISTGYAGNCNLGGATNGVYDETKKSNDCEMFFQING